MEPGTLWLDVRASSRVPGAFALRGRPVILPSKPQRQDAKGQNLADRFDDNGNPTSYKGTSGYLRDSENRLTQAGTALSAGYRGDCLRAWKRSGGVQTFFLYDGALPVVEFTHNSTTKTATITAVNTFGPAGLLSRNSNAANTSAFYTFDPQGSVCQRLDSSGNVLSSHFFDAYGAEYDQPSGKTTPFGYGAQWGYYTDSETKLVLLTNRYYDPARARFLTRDPIGYAGGTNLYGYL